MRTPPTRTILGRPARSKLQRLVTDPGYERIYHVEDRATRWPDATLCALDRGKAGELDTVNFAEFFFHALR
jgi:hypothetical protein